MSEISLPQFPENRYHHSLILQQSANMKQSKCPQGTYGENWQFFGILHFYMIRNQRNVLV